MNPAVIVLVGMPASGKSRVGRELAAALGVQHRDSDSLIESTQGRSIPEIFANDGEDVFRAIEEEVIAHALELPGVLSLGGGALISARTRERLRDRCVIYIEAELSELLRRAAGSARPLLAGNAEERLKELWEQRKDYFHEVASITVQTNAGPSQEVVLQVLNALGEKTMVRTIPVEVDQPYDVVIGRDFPITTLSEKLRSNATKILILCAPPLHSYALSIAHKLQAQGYMAITHVLPDGEEAKTIENLSDLWDLAGRERIGRADCVVVIGGGATTDVGGFLAASWLRGIDFIAVPTTLLGMVDASVGGKTGINTAVGKNLVGAFHSPRRVIVDLDHLKTLSKHDYRAGLGEVVKCGFIADPRILEIIESDPEAIFDPNSEVIAELIEHSIAVKARVVSMDLHESGPREFLNYGHTLAHAIEKLEHFDFRHGEAVAIGCVFAAHLAHQRGLLSEEDVRRHEHDFACLGLPTHYQDASIEDLLNVMLSDKKVRAGVLRFVLLDGIENPVTLPITPDEVRACADSMGMKR